MNQQDAAERQIADAVLQAFRVTDPSALERTVNSMQAWEDLDVDARDALAGLVREALLRMADNVEEWLPEAAVIQPKESIGIFLWWKLGHVDEEIVRNRARAAADSERRLADLLRIAGRSGGRHDETS